MTADVCIVGAGAVGISIARELGGSPLTVALLESGGLEYDEATYRLADGENVGLDYSLLGARLRYFGGSLNHWEGTSRPLDSIDFERRDCIPHSGWPFGRDVLDPFYERAHEVCRLGPFDYDPESYLRRSAPTLTPLGDDFVTKIFVYSSAVFGDVYREEIEEAENITTYLYANAVKLETDEGGEEVVRVQAACLPGNRFSVAAGLYVLAAGGLDTPRLLLLSNRVRSAGLGNQNDLVGRYFMEHACFNCGLVEAREPELLEPYNPVVPRTRHGAPYTAAVSPAEATLRDQELANYAAWMWPLEDEEIAGLGFQGPSRSGARMYRLSIHAEQAPNPESRVTLGEERDALGLRRVRLDWRMTPDDKDSVRRVHALIARQVEARGLGRFHPELSPGDDPQWSPDLWGCSHHMGTTRMSEDPKTGVVDANCRVHGVSNLYVGGSAVFPTSGFANPTLTIVALALRLADRIKGVVG